MPNEILIVGAGAVGAFYASRLALAPNTNVSVICRSNYPAVKAHGFKIHSPQYGTYTFVPSQIFANPSEALKNTPEKGWDFIVVSTKALPDVVDDSEILEGLVGEKTAIVLIQNGVGVEEPYLKRFPGASILSAVTVISAAQPENGVIQHNRWTRINVGPYLPHTDPQQPTTTTTTTTANNSNSDPTSSISSSSTSSTSSSSSSSDLATTTTTSNSNADPTLSISSSSSSSSSSDLATTRTDHFISLLTTGGIKDASAYPHPKLQLTRWHKLAINASMNPSSVLSSGTPNALMTQDPELSLHLRGCMHEILTTAPKILGMPFPEDFATAEQIMRSTSRNKSGSKPSMLLDWEAGRRMELEVILGNPVRIARARGWEMPRVQSLYALLRMAQENREKRKDEEGNKEKSKL